MQLDEVGVRRDDGALRNGETEPLWINDGLRGTSDYLTQRVALSLSGRVQRGWYLIVRSVGVR